MESLNRSFTQIELRETIENIVQSLENYSIKDFLIRHHHHTVMFKNLWKSWEIQVMMMITKKKICRENIENAALIAQFQIELDNKNMKLQKLVLEHQQLEMEYQSKIQGLRASWMFNRPKWSSTRKKILRDLVEWQQAWLVQLLTEVTLM